ncbi:MAG TPA: glycosyltransferase family 87 protein [Candidatus Eisenbacteria bacterium]|nr:glycosyltransferase family 87 protein [Candidatus Eisenbacteria bacterium]
MTRRSPLDDRRFRAVLLAIAGVPIAALYAWQNVFLPIVVSGYLGDFTASYMRAAARLSAGQDPYDLCQTMGCLEPTGPQYVTPPPLAWLLQPAVGLDSHLVVIGAVIVLNASLAVFLFFVLRAMRVDDWQLALLLVLVALAFEPVSGNIEEGQVNLILLALSGVWLLGWIADRWWGGVALGVAVALKLIQAPMGLLVLWARRWSMLAAAFVAGLGLWLLAAPQYLLEYLFKVVPAIGAGTGFFENHSPGGTVARFFDSTTFLGATHGAPLAARIITTGIAVAALGVTFWVLRRPRTDGQGRALEAAAVVAVGPLVASYSWGTHLVLLLLPMLVLIAWAVRRRDWIVLGLVAAGWLLIGPGHNRFQALLISGYPNMFVLRLMAEVGVAGITCVWIACLLALRRSANRLDAAREYGADQ